MTDDSSREDPRFLIPLPGGRVARVPPAVLLRYVEREARIMHRADEDDDDVMAHDLKPDPATGVSEYHTDYEHGECIYEDGSGTSQRIIAWHRHPFGTEYAELFEG